MAEKIPMLALSPTMEEGVIVKWLKNEGESVEPGDILCEVETDKATMEYESVNDGVLLKILAAEGSSLAVGETIAIIGAANEDISSVIGEDTASAEPPPAANTTPSESTKVRSTPLARRIAQQRNIDIGTVTGTGPAGRITQADVEEYAPTLPQTADRDETIVVTQKRKVIADKLSKSKFTAPHYYLTLTVTADALTQARQTLNANNDTKVSLNAFLMKFVAEALNTHPVINSTWAGDKIIQHHRIDIALAVAQPDGLIAPVVRDCASKGILQIDGELKILIEKTRKGTLSSADYANSTFTISSLGALGIEQFTAIINPPNSAILAIGGITKQPVFDDDGAVSARQWMKMTLCCDHRVIDGTVGARFLSDLKHMIENPIAALY